MALSRQNWNKLCRCGVIGVRGSSVYQCLVRKEGPGVGREKTNKWNALRILFLTLDCVVSINWLKKKKRGRKKEKQLDFFVTFFLAVAKIHFCEIPF